MKEKWILDESKQIGVDYTKQNIANDYDNQHNDFRNYDLEVKNILDEIHNIDIKELTVIDMGCGTGSFAICASKYFKKIFAIDISKSMLAVAEEKAKKLDISNIDFINSGFLSYRHNSEKVDFLITKYAFHHFSDFWKQVGLFNMNKMLKIGGILYIHDVVLQFDPKEYKTKINDWIQSYSDKLKPEFLEEFEIHIRDEFSTFNWILEGLIERAGFKIKKVKNHDGFSSEYLCKKTKDINIT